MIKPKTEQKDYFAFDREKKEFMKKATHEQMSLNEFKKGMTGIENKYQGRVFPEDTYLFGSFKEFEDFIKKSGFYNEMIESLEHERAHGEKAEELGYTVSYGCSFMLTGDNPFPRFLLQASPITYKTFIKIKEIVVAPDHARQIIEAPRRMSRTDRDLIKLISEVE